MSSSHLPFSFRDRWFREDEGRGRIAMSGGGRVRVVEGQLVMEGARMEDSGFYLCLANNSAGTDSYR